MVELPSVRDGVQRREKTRKNSFLNHESPALTAELQAVRSRIQSYFIASGDYFSLEQGTVRSNPRGRRSIACANFVINHHDSESAQRSCPAAPRRLPE